MSSRSAPSIYQLLNAWGRAVAGTSHPQPPTYNGPDVIIRRFQEDSRLVQPGDCFVARLRARHDGSIYSDGHPYIPQAVANGAALVLGQRLPAEIEMPPGVPYLQAADTGIALAWLAAAWQGFPSQQLVVVGITGTDGKTTVTNLLYAILQAAGVKAGMISTINAYFGDQAEDTGLHVTTPEAPAVQQYLRRMVDAGLTHCLLETTSHALAQYRVGAVAFDVAVVTNIVHEHLDYHGSYEGYLAAKARLFQALNDDPLPLPAAPAKQALTKAAILNRDDASYAPLRRIPAPIHVTYGLRLPGDARAEAIEYAADATRFSLILDTRAARHTGTEPLPPAPPRPWPITTPLVGAFNVYNMLAAAAAADVLGIAEATIQQGLQAVTGISGRMQRIHRGQGFMVVVDFAHTPNALAQAIAAARGMTGGRVIVVFGSAGKRDVEKRRIMSEVAARDADLAVLTAEDPRTESLDDILEMMAAGCRREGGVEGATFWRVPDRGRAIYFALHLAAQPDDLVLICGKGHEQSMCFGVTEYPWDDRQATVAALDAFLAGEPMPDLGLPTFSPSQPVSLS